MNNDEDLPSLRELGLDLVRVTPRRRVLTMALPFLWAGAYFGFALLGWWPLAVFSLIALSFFTYGSTSHDLVHRNLGLPQRLNDGMLSLIELLALRSGHAYQAAHLHHHAHYPDPDDIEATAAYRSFLGAIAEGFVFQFRIWFWAVKRCDPKRAWIIAEGIACLGLVGLAIALSSVTMVFLVYVGLMIMGSWLLPLATSYLPHDPHGENPLQQTRAFRGVVASVVAVEHLYHLEHHLYPAVPHQNWPKLAKRLEPYLEKAGVKFVRFWF